MTVKEVIDEDFVNYKETSMFIAFPTCNFKCGFENCQNSHLLTARNTNLSPITLTNRYLRNPISKAVVIGGLEPFDSFYDLFNFIFNFRQQCTDTIVIYTGYDRNELEDKLEWLAQQQNIIIKYGRYMPDLEPRYDEILGVTLASSNQYAEIIT